MKQLLILLFVLSCGAVNAQTDTSKLTSKNLTLRVNDWEYVSTFIAYSETHENLWDSVKVKLRGVTYPSGTTLITVGAVTNGELFILSQMLRDNYNAATASVIDRIHSAMRAMNASAFHWLNRQLDALDAGEAAALTNRRQEGKRRLRKQ